MKQESLDWWEFALPGRSVQNWQLPDHPDGWIPGSRASETGSWFLDTRFSPRWAWSLV